MVLTHCDKCNRHRESGLCRCPAGPFIYRHDDGSVSNRPQAMGRSCLILLLVVAAIMLLLPAACDAAYKPRFTLGRQGSCGVSCSGGVCRVVPRAAGAVVKKRGVFVQRVVNGRKGGM